MKANDWKQTADYVLVAPNGCYYTGKAGIYCCSSSLWEAFSYTFKGAEVRKNSNTFFKDFEIKHKDTVPNLVN